MRAFQSFILGLFLLTGAIALPQLASAGSYDGDDAASYALDYCGNEGEMTSTGYNPAYTAFESDCTNFVSQALYYGGWEETGWNVYDADHWFYNGSSTAFISRTWRLVDYLESFLNTSGRAAGPYAVDSSTYSYYLPGDIILADWEDDDDMDHAYIVTAVYSDRLELAAHTTNHCGGDANPDFTTTSVYNDPGVGDTVYMEGYFLYSSY